MCLSHNLNRVGDEFPAGQAVSHARVIHSDAVADSDGIDLERSSSSAIDSFLDSLGDSLEVLMSGNDLTEAVYNADEGLFYFPWA